MKFHELAPDVFRDSPITGRRKTQICLPRRRSPGLVRLTSYEILEIPGVARVGNCYQVVGENGDPSPGRIEVLAIVGVDVRYTLLDSSVIACGYATLREFLRVWAHRYDEDFYNEHILGCKLRKKGISLRALLSKRPNQRYNAWRITFKPVQ